MSVDIETVGKSIGSIPVHFSYNIIELFSGHLYSSPIKAIEELVANSYDAFASQCIVSVPEKTEGQCVWVWDDGDSMDLGGLKDLWLVAAPRREIQKRKVELRREDVYPLGSLGLANWQAMYWADESPIFAERTKSISR